MVFGGLLQPLDLVGDRVLEQPLLGQHLLAAEREDQPLGLLDQLHSRSLPLADLRLDLIRRAQQRPKQRVVADNPPVLARVTGHRHPPGQLVDRLGTADLL